MGAERNRNGIAPTPRALLLDALGTLVRLEPIAPRLRAELARRFGVEVSEADAVRAARAEMSYYRLHVAMGADRAGLAALRRACAEVVAEALALGGRALEEVEDALLAAVRFTAFDDAAGALQALRARGLRLVVVSNWDVSLHDVLGTTGLSELVDGAIASAEIGVAKPDPAIFARGLALAGVGPDGAWHVGDTPEEDVAGARAAGLGAVLIDRDGGVDAAGALHVIRSLAELPALCG